MSGISIVIDIEILLNAQDINPRIVEDDVQSLMVFLQALEDYRFRLRKITTTCPPVLMTVGCADAKRAREHCT
jgi:hypothetical protein